jgi:hypothetical protein
MAETGEPQMIEVPVSLLAPVKLAKQAAEEVAALFFPHRKNLPLGLVVPWNGDTHLVHLVGPYAFKEGQVWMGNPIRGVLLRDIEYRVDATSAYNSGEQFDPPGALILKDGELSISCQKLGEQFADDPYPVPLKAGLLRGSAEEACGFTRWSIVVQDGDETKVIRSFDVSPKEE